VAFAWLESNAWRAGQDAYGVQVAQAMNCPECQRVITQLELIDPSGERRRQIVWPRTTNRPPCPPEVPDPFRSDYTQSALVLQDSPKASAALSRRCLQHILRDIAKVKATTLEKEINEVIARNTLPTAIAADLDAVRHIGNFAAHPTKSQNTGELIDVEPGEAEWNLEVVEALLDIYFVQPERLKAKKAALNAKLKEAGKPEIP